MDGRSMSTPLVAEISEGGLEGVAMETRGIMGFGRHIGSRTVGVWRGAS